MIEAGLLQAIAIARENGKEVNADQMAAGLAAFQELVRDGLLDDISFTSENSDTMTVDDTSRQLLNPLRRQVMGQVLSGRTVNQAAQSLTMSPHTVKAHLANVYRFLDVGSSHEAAWVLLETGVFTVQELLPNIERAVERASNLTTREWEVVRVLGTKPVVDIKSVAEELKESGFTRNAVAGYMGSIANKCHIPSCITSIIVLSHELVARENIG